MIRNLLLNQENQEKIAIIDGDKKILYRDLAQKALALQQYLPQGSRAAISIFLPNGGDYIAALFGTLMLGITAFPLNITMTKYEIITLLDQTSIYTVITSKIFSSIFDEIRFSHLPSLQVIYMEDLHPWKCEHLPEIINPAAKEPMLLLNTSGTTGNLKIVQLSEMNFESSVLGYIDKMNFKEMSLNNIRYILATPFSSAYGLMILSACLINSFPIVLLREGFTLNMFYKTAEKHKATHYEGGALVLLLMEQTAGRPIPYDISPLKHFGFGGSKVSANTLKVLLNTYPEIKFFQGYGMTEASPLITKYTNAKPEKLESVGTAIKGMKIAVETNNIITDTPYTKGEIIVKGPNVMLGYYKNETETNNVLKNGYLYTGDIGYLDGDGYLYICGRKKNIIIIRGLNVHPEEVEACILNSLLAKDCIVYGKIDSFGNEFICADIIPINPQIQIEDIKAYYRTHLSAYKQPQKIQLVDAIKKAASGKSKRKEHQ